MKNNLFIKIFVSVVFIGSGSVYLHAMDTVEDLENSHRLAKDVRALWQEKKEQELDQKGKLAEELVEKTKREMAARQAAEERERKNREAEQAKNATKEQEKPAAVKPLLNSEAEKIVMPIAQNQGLQSPVKVIDPEKPQGWTAWCEEHKGKIGVMVVGLGAVAIYKWRNG